MTNHSRHSEESSSATVGETSALLGSCHRPEDQKETHQQHDHHHHHHGSASISQTVINEVKTCMGTGTLALPFAARVGGITLHVVGLAAIGMWNLYCVNLLCQCLQLLPREAVLEDEHDNADDDVIAVVGNEASDKRNSFREEVKEEQQHEHQNLSEEIIISNSQVELEMALPNSPPCHHRPHSGGGVKGASTNEQLIDGSRQYRQSNTGRIHTIKHPPRGTSTYSRVAFYAFGPLGLLALDLMMISLFIGVVVAFVDATRGFLRDTPVSTGSEILDAICIAFIIGPMSAVPDMGYLARASAVGLGVLFFSFAVIAAYGLLELYSGGEDTSLNGANNHWDNNSTTISSLNWGPDNGIDGVSKWFGCIVFGYGIAPLTYNFRESMAEPTHMVQASSIALMIVAGSYVLLGVGLYVLIPDIDGDVLRTLPEEGWFPVMTRVSMALVIFATAPLLVVPCGQLVEGKILHTNEIDDISHTSRALVRMGIALLCVSISVLVPGFVGVLSLVGCASVAAVGFVVPPLLFLRLRYMRSLWSRNLVFDVMMLLWGISATVISTSFTLASIRSGQ